jgi:hypothetical protein
MSDNTLRATSVEIRDNNVVIAPNVPVLANGTWNYQPPALTPGPHVFTAHADGQLSNNWVISVGTEQMNLTPPHFRLATSVGPNREEINYYAHEGDGSVEIPDYGRRVGDSVRLTWVGRRVTVQSEIQTVTDPAVPIVFKISMYELIDCIGVNATLTYTVVRAPAGPSTSQSMSLSVFGHVGAIEAPTINSPDNNNIRVQFRDDYYSAQVRFIGLTTVESPIREFHGNYINFPINETWRSQNRGRLVLFNYSLRRFGNTQIYYSQILRVNNL